jgi:hypothetical protein
MFLIFHLHKEFHIKCVVVLTVYLSIKIHLLNFNGHLVTTIKQYDNENFSSDIVIILRSLQRVP